MGWGARISVFLTGACMAVALWAPGVAVAFPNPDYRVTLRPDVKPIGEVIALHGGGWVGGTDRALALAGSLGYLTNWGWRVDSVDYRTGVPSLPDVVSWYDRIAAETAGPICVLGLSAGANLSLLLAAKRGVDCVIGQAPLTYLPETEAPWDIPDSEDPYIRRRLGPDNLDRFSPLLRWRAITARVLLGHGRDDPLVPVAQSRVFQRRDESTSLFVLDPGTAPFPHGSVDEIQLAEFRDAQHRLLNRVAP